MKFCTTPLTILSPIVVNPAGKFVSGWWRGAEPVPDPPPRVFTVCQVDTIDLLKSNTDHLFMSTSFRLSFDCAHPPACYTYYQYNTELLHIDERDWVAHDLGATFIINQTDHQLSVSPYWSGHCHCNLQICTYVHSSSSCRPQTWREVRPLSCEKPAFKQKKKDKKKLSSDGKNNGLFFTISVSGTNKKSICLPDLPHTSIQVIHPDFIIG